MRTASVVVVGQGWEKSEYESRYRKEESPGDESHEYGQVACCRLSEKSMGHRKKAGGFLLTRRQKQKQASSSKAVEREVGMSR